MPGKGLRRVVKTAELSPSLVPFLHFCLFESFYLFTLISNKSEKIIKKQNSGLKIHF